MERWIENEGMSSIECGGFKLNTVYMLWEKDRKFLLKSSLKSQVGNLIDTKKCKRVVLQKHPDKRDGVKIDDTNQAIEKLSLINNPPDKLNVMKIVNERCRAEMKNMDDFEPRKNNIGHFDVLCLMFMEALNYISYDGIFEERCEDEGDATFILDDVIHKCVDRYLMLLDTSRKIQFFVSLFVNMDEMSINDEFEIELLDLLNKSYVSKYLVFKNYIVVSNDSGRQFTHHELVQVLYESDDELFGWYFAVVDMHTKAYFWLNPNNLLEYDGSMSYFEDDDKVCTIRIFCEPILVHGPDRISLGGVSITNESNLRNLIHKNHLI
jgi:hypothetical protein